MESFLLYILKVSLGVALISLPYYFLLRGDTHLNLKRFFLLGGLMLAFILPALNLSFSARAMLGIPNFFIDIDSPVNPAVENLEISEQSNVVFPWKFIVLGLYLLGSMLLVLRNFISLISWITIRKRSKPMQKGVFYSDKNEVFSLFRKIHLPKSILTSEDYSSILIHEQAHVRQMHFIDLLISEAAVLLTWFNPFTWLIFRMIKENHEHLADREVLSQGVNPARYRAFLLNQTLGVPVFRLGHSINHSLTKNRFDMMKKFKSKNSAMLKALLLMPAILLSLAFVNISQAQDGKVQGIVKFSDTAKPATGTSVVIKNSTVGTVVDEKGHFELNLTGKEELVFSFVGYKTNVSACEPGQSIKVKLYPTVINLDIDEKNIKGDNKIAVKSKEGIEPVYILDGKRVNDISNINKNDIEKINVIKDIAIIEKKYPGLDYSHGVLEITSKKTPPIETTKHRSEVFYVVEDMPKYPGGKAELAKFIYSTLEYPAEAMAKKIEGSVLVEFVVNAEGNVVDQRVIQSTNSIFEAAALRIFDQMPDWSPGKQRGKAVEVIFTVPVKFNLPASES